MAVGEKQVPKTCGPLVQNLTHTHMEPAHLNHIAQIVPKKGRHVVVKHTNKSCDSSCFRLAENAERQPSLSV